MHFCLIFQQNVTAQNVNKNMPPYSQDGTLPSIEQCSLIKEQTFFHQANVSTSAENIIIHSIQKLAHFCQEFQQSTKAFYTHSSTINKHKTYK